jgi:hypothetical protein
VVAVVVIVVVGTSACCMEVVFPLFMDSWGRLCT